MAQVLPADLADPAAEAHQDPQDHPARPDALAVPDHKVMLALPRPLADVAIMEALAVLDNQAQLETTDHQALLDIQAKLDHPDPQVPLETLPLLAPRDHPAHLVPQEPMARMPTTVPAHAAPRRLKYHKGNLFHHDHGTDFMFSAILPFVLTTLVSLY